MLKSTFSGYNAVADIRLAVVAS